MGKKYKDIQLYLNKIYVYSKSNADPKEAANNLQNDFEMVEISRLITAEQLKEVCSSLVTLHNGYNKVYKDYNSPYRNLLKQNVQKILYKLPDDRFAKALQDELNESNKRGMIILEYLGLSSTIFTPS